MCAPTSIQQSTNTLIVAQLPVEFFELAYLQALRDVFARHGEIHTWAPIRVFRRAIVTFWRPEDAERAKRDLDGLILPSDPPHQIRVYRGAHTPIRRVTEPSSADYDPFYLAPPRLEKNFLISPPGSPPVGWEPIVEEPPNAAPLASDLIAALTKLQLTQNEEGVRRTGSGSGVEIVYEDADGGRGITVSVVDMDEQPDYGDEEEEELRRAESPVEEDTFGNDVWVNGRRPGFTLAGERARFVPTALPPIRSH
ncbi:Calcipressin [Exidia glandulosa HHB12029]|uniref:Calcipressin n=1 Tax=Exidia glandulosa HHB12029 TaxID=1314781 RepID=A0A166N3X8_EXIGL|nr:Calcipressin [Exidia glandulosa HHB12029]